MVADLKKVYQHAVGNKWVHILKGNFRNIFVGEVPMASPSISLHKLLKKFDYSAPENKISLFTFLIIYVVTYVVIYSLIYFVHLFNFIVGTADSFC